MGSEWRISKIRELAKVKGGKRLPKGNKLSEEGTSHPYIRVVDFSDGRISLSNLLYVPEEVFPSIKRYTVDSGNVVISIVGTIGLVATIPPELHKASLTENAAKIMIANSNVDPYYLFWYLKSPFGQYEIQRNTVGSTQPKLPLYGIENIDVRYPLFPEQRAISHILGSLDDKIESNRRMNKTLEEMARAIFKSWFVDFDPVRAKAEGRDTGLPDEIAALFPNSLQDSELGEIPNGWEVKPLTKSIDFKEGPGIRNWQYTNSDEGTRFINIRCIKNGDLDLNNANRIHNEEAFGKYRHFQLREDDLVVSTSGTLGRSAIVRPEHLPLVLNTSVIRMRPIPPNCTLPYLVGYVDTRLQRELERYASGSVQRNFGPMHLEQIRMLVPPRQVLEVHEEFAGEWLRMSSRLRSESSTLASLRDTLLPKLISCELRVPDAEKFVDEASL